MRRFFWLISLLVFVPISISAEGNEKNFPQWHTRDLYYYDANSTMVQLNLVPKLFVRFNRDLTAQERVSFFSEFSPAAQKPGLDNSSTFLEFNDSTNSSELLEMANKMARSGLAVAFPVFLVENIEAILEGIAVEPKVVLSAERMLERMKKYGNFSLLRTASENGTWVFFTDEISPPLNLLVLTNLVHNDSWVRRAYPRFRFLHDPIIANLTVEPVSGTVGEVRAVALTIKIFDPAITLSENELPEFGKGLFLPIQGSTITSSSVQYPPGYLFELLGNSTKLQMKQEKRSRTYTISWKFKHHALGEWTIPPQPVSYVKNGVPQEIKSSDFTLVVNSQIGALNIADMPFPYSLTYPLKTPEVISETALPPIPSYWFDFWVSNKNANLVAQYAGWAGALLGALGVGTIGTFIAGRIRITYDKRASRRRLTEQIEKILEGALSRRSYADYAKALSCILTVLFPHLSSRPTWEEIKNDELIRETLTSEKFELLERVFGELSRRHSKDFTASAESLAELDKNIRKIREAT